MRIHKEERKYLCPDCGYKCKWVNQLKYHMTKHTGEWCPLGTGHGAPGRVLGVWEPLLRASFATVLQLEAGEGHQQLGVAHSCVLLDRGQWPGAGGKVGW